MAIKRDELGKFAPNGEQKYHKGYPVVYRPDHPRARANGYVYEHIIVMETKLGRPLEPGEVVHHIDENKRNNSPDNLMLFKNQREHDVFHWANRSQKYMMPDGTQATIGQIAELAGISYGKAYQRLRKLGWTVSKTIAKK